MDPAEADYPNLVSAIRESEAIRKLVDQPVNAVTRLSESIILYECHGDQIGRPRQRHSVLLDVGDVPGRIELDLNPCSIAGLEYCMGV